MTLILTCLDIARPKISGLLQQAALRLNRCHYSKRIPVEQIYQKKTQLEHILLRPDAYIGSAEPMHQCVWTYDPVTGRMSERDVTLPPGLYKIFDEILVNAADNKQRDPSMTRICVTISQSDNSIEIWNNGKGIPVVLHRDEQLYVPTLIFGHLLTSSNFDDNQRKTTGGRNGFGAKLCNLYSSEFTVETSCRQSGKRFQQTWTDNMTKVSEASISQCAKKDFTRIRFKPDLAKFGMSQLSDDTVALFSRRAVDIAGTCPGVEVFLNETRLPVASFSDYCRLYLGDRVDTEVAVASSERWQIVACLSSDGFRQMSFVNCIATSKGGRHVELVMDQLVKRITESVEAKCRSERRSQHSSTASVKPAFVRNQLWLFCNCLIDNASFDSQTKEFMTLPAKRFGSQPIIGEKFFKKLLSDECGIVRSVMEFLEFKATKQLTVRQKPSAISFHEKLDHANNAGRDADCVLILTEGDSAKSLAVTGASSLPHGRDKFGVFPLKGKLLNVRDASWQQLQRNHELRVITDAVNLQFGKRYTTPADLLSLRYRRLLIMADQDLDGSHIKGLVANFIHHFWPELLQHDFLSQFITPIVRVSRAEQSHAFYTLEQFEQWRQLQPDWQRWQVKYYKGLGTSTAAEGRMYFSDMQRHCIGFQRRGCEDDEAMQLAFGRDADRRKQWLLQFMSQRKLQQQQQQQQQQQLPAGGSQSCSSSNQLPENGSMPAQSLSEFVNKELVLYSNADNERSIPSLIDGLKPGQRKILFTCFKRNLLKEIKVSQLAGSVSELSAYHHGEASLIGSIVGLAQDFVGSNNINLLQPVGQFGSRLQGGKDAAAARYIHTCLSPLARIIFNPLDDPMLTYHLDDCQVVEPVWYMPIIPMVLVNGAEGIGTGWSTKIPNHSVDDIVENIRRMLAGQQPQEMLPNYRGFKGEIRRLDQHRYITFGEVHAYGSSGVLEITELPLRVWSDSYQDSVLKSALEAKAASGSRRQREAGPNEQLIEAFSNYCSDTEVRLLVKLQAEQLAKARADGVHKYLRLCSSFSTASMVLFDADHCLKRYNSSLEILEEFFTLRLKWYAKRKQYQLGQLQAECQLLANQAAFVQEVGEGRFSISDATRQEVVAQLRQRGFASNPLAAWRQQQQQQQQQQQLSSAAEEQADNDSDDFDYILRMPLWSLTLEKKEALLNERNSKEAAVKELRDRSPSDLWLRDLDWLQRSLSRMEEAGSRKAKSIGAAASESDLDTSQSAVSSSAAKRRGKSGIVIPQITPKIVPPTY